jgi:hypothetical protein
MTPYFFTPVESTNWELEEKYAIWLKPEAIDELIDTNPKCRLFFKIDLQDFRYCYFFAL